MAGDIAVAATAATQVTQDGARYLYVCCVGLFTLSRGQSSPVGSGQGGQVSPPQTLLTDSQVCHIQPLSGQIGNLLDKSGTLSDQFGVTK